MILLLWLHIFFHACLYRWFDNFTLFISFTQLMTLALQITSTQDTGFTKEHYFKYFTNNTPKVADKSTNDILYWFGGSY